MKSYTDIEQSKKFAEILPIKSADSYWDYDEMQKFHRISWFEDGFNKHSQLLFNENNVCAWSLAALRACLPSGISIDGILYVFESHNTFDNEWVYEYKFEKGQQIRYCEPQSCEIEEQKETAYVLKYPKGR